MGVMALFISILVGLPWLFLVLLPFFLILVPVFILPALVGGQVMWDIVNETKLRSFRVLLIDDDPSSLMVIKDVLKKHQIQFKVLTNSLEGAGAMSHGRYDLVILDNHMPHLTGVQVLEHADELVDSNFEKVPIKNTPVIGYSSFEKSAWAVAPLRHFSLVKTLSKTVSPAALWNDLKLLCTQ